MAKIRDWVEPAHPAVIKQYEDLINIYRFLREGVQEDIDKVFDKISSQIGFVVATTLPVTLQLSEGAKVEKVELAGRNLAGTIFEREFAPLFKRLAGRAMGKGLNIAGSYNLAFIWFDALKLKLKHDWMEPAHFRGLRPELLQELTREAAIKVRPEVQEPAHWFDANIALEMEEELLISAIDEVYGELKLAERVAGGRYQSRKLIPGVREPAHYRQILDELIEARVDARKLIPGVREPAHFRNLSELLENPQKLQLLGELATLLRKLGL